MTRLRMVADAIAALISAITTTPAKRRAINERNHLLLADKVIAAEQPTERSDQ